MRRCGYAALLAAFVVGLGCLSFGVAQDANSPSAKKKSKTNASKSVSATAPASSTDREVLLAQSRDFVAAFNKGDAKTIAAMWTETGDYVDDAGRTFTGRAAIEQEYASFFAEHPGHTLRLAVDSLKLLSDSAAIEDGRAVLEPVPAGPPAMSKYTAVHVKIAGQWFMSIVRDTRIETPSGYHHLQELEWMIGSWSAEEHGVKSEVTCRWIANKSFLERSYSVTGRAGHMLNSGVQIIGWNPSEEHVQSWNFASDGGQAVGTWAPRERGWEIVTRGLLPDGAPTSAVTLLTRLDDDAIAWQSVARTAAGVPLPDTDEVVFKRNGKNR